jgi:hypothetical protein
VSQAAQCDRCKQFVSTPKRTDWLAFNPQDPPGLKPDGWISLTHYDFSLDRAVNVTLCTACKADFNVFMSQA